MYNFLTNDWKDTPHQLTYDVRQPKTQAYKRKAAPLVRGQPPH